MYLKYDVNSAQGWSCNDEQKLILENNQLDELLNKETSNVATLEAHVRTGALVVSLVLYCIDCTTFSGA